MDPTPITKKLYIDPSAEPTLARRRLERGFSHDVVGFFWGLTAKDTGRRCAWKKARPARSSFEEAAACCRLKRSNLALFLCSILCTQRLPCFCVNTV